MRKSLILVNMPFAGIQFPSIQLGLLQALAASAGISTRSLYANIDFAQLIGPALFNTLSNHRGVLIGEWIFGVAAFGDEIAQADRFETDFPAAFADVEKATGATAAELRNLRAVVAPRFISDLAAEIVAAGPTVIGLTSTFEQNVASIALARAIKGLDPNTVTLFGGANFDGTMGPAYMEAIPWIDVCVVGEADEVFVPLVEALINGGDLPELPGVLSRHAQSGGTKERASFKGSMDDLPAPFYDDYFETLKRLGLSEKELGRSIFLPFESSRGCWWGEKHHCTFCGLNALGMAFRAKSATKVLAEVSHLTERYHINRFAAVDNILSPKLMNDLAEEIAEGNYDYEFFYEIKANLNREKIRQLYNSGVRHIQPGIESLSTHVLKLMRKGITSIQNVNSLRWMNYYGFEILWNLIYGFPGEEDADYLRQLEILGHLGHLAPPNYVGRIWLERFSPIYSDSAAFGFADVRPHASYAYVYPPAVDLQQASYFFEGEAANTVSDDFMQGTRDAVADWRSRWRMDVLPFLRFIRTHAGIHIHDGRQHPDNPLQISYRSPGDAIYLYCSDQPRALHSVAQHVRDELGITLQDGNLEALLDRFVARGFMIEEGGLYLSLALPAYRRA